MSEDTARISGPGSPADAGRIRHADLDAAIDVVAREMTSLDAPATLRADVLAEIAGGGRPGRFALPRWAWAATAAAAFAVVVLVAAIWMTRPAPEPESSAALRGAAPASAGAGRTAGGGSPDAVVAAAGSMSGGLQNAAPGSRRAGAASAAAPDANSAEPDAGPAPLAAPQPIAVADLGPAVIEVTGIEVAPLNQLQPLAIKDISVGSTDPIRRQDR